MQEKGYDNVPWITKRWSIAIVICIAFFVILSATFCVAYKHFDDKKTLELSEDKTVANLISLAINEKQRAITGTLLSYASRPLVVRAAKRKSYNGVKGHLVSLQKSDPAITSVFVTDKAGTLWAINPLIEETIGKNYAYRDWYKGVSRHWKPYISDALQRTVKEKDVVIFACTPVIDEKGQIISIIGVSQRTVFLSDQIRQFRLNPGSTITIIDRVGNMICSDRPEYSEKVVPYPFFSMLRDASNEERTIELEDPAIGGGIRYISFARIKDTGWMVVVSRDRKSLIRAEYGYLLMVSGISFLLFLLVVFSLVYIRNRVINRQLSELLKTEKALSVSAECFKLASNATNDAVWDWNLTTNEIWWGDNFKKLLRYKDVEIEPDINSWYGHIHPDDKERVVSGVHAAIDKGEQFWSDEYRFLRSDGSVAYILDRGYVVRDDNGRAVRMVGAMTDMTDRRLFEEALKESETRLRLTLEATNEGIWDWDFPTGNAVFSPHYYTMLGYEPYEFQQNYESWRSLVHPDDIEKTEKHIQKCILEGKSYSVEFRMRTKSGGWKWILGRGNVVEKDAEGKPLRMLGTHTDIDVIKRVEISLRASEERWRDLFVRTSNAIAVYDAVDNGEDFVFKDFNPAGERIEGVKRGDIVGHRVTEIFPGVREFGLLDVFKRVWMTGVAEHHDVSFYKDNRIQGWRDNYIIKLSTGEVVAVYEDLTDKKKAEEEILMLNTELEQRVRDRTAQLEAANKELEAFAYSVSHDLRAPLRGIDGFSQILIEDYGDVIDEKGKNFLRRIRAASQHLGELIDDLLRLSRVSRSEIRYENVNLSGLVRTITEEFKKMQPGRDVEFAIEDNITGRGDPNLIKIALENMLNNAFKFTRRNVHAKIEFYSVSQNGEKIYCIRDNGVGFEMEFADKLFGAFQRLHSRTEFEGTGVGLATVQRIIHKHGGRIWAEAEVGKGAVFFFTLS